MAEPAPWPLVALLFLAAGSAPAVGDDPARDLLRACSADVATLNETTRDAYLIGYCDGFVHAIGGLWLRGSLYCPPKGATADDARRAIIDYLKPRQHRLDEIRVNMLLEAYQAAWPCEKYEGQQ